MLSHPAQISKNPRHYLWSFALHGLADRLVKNPQDDSSEIRDLLESFYRDNSLTVEDKLQLLKEKNDFCYSYNKDILNAGLFYILCLYATPHTVKGFLEFLATVAKAYPSRAELHQILTATHAKFPNRREGGTASYNFILFESPDVSLRIAYLDFLQTVFDKTLIPSLLPDLNWFAVHPDAFYFVVEKKLYDDFGYLAKLSLLKSIKSGIFEYLKSLPINQSNDALINALDKHHSVGKLFWQPRSSFRKPSTKRGYLAKILRLLGERKIEINMTPEGEFLTSFKLLPLQPVIMPETALPKISQCSPSLEYTEACRGFTVYLMGAPIHKDNYIYYFLKEFYETSQINFMQKLRLLFANHKGGAVGANGNDICCYSMASAIVMHANVNTILNFLLFLESLLTNSRLEQNERFMASALVFSMLTTNMDEVKIPLKLCESNNVKILTTYIKILKIIQAQDKDQALFNQFSLPPLFFFQWHKHFLFALINEGLYSSVARELDQVDTGKLKSLIFHYLENLDANELKSILPNAVNPKHPLGELFWQQRGIDEPDLQHGYLKKLAQLALKKAVSLDPSIIHLPLEKATILTDVIKQERANDFHNRL